jgi:hypothetical protein
MKEKRRELIGILFSYQSVVAKWFCYAVEIIGESFFIALFSYTTVVEK